MGSVFTSCVKSSADAAARRSRPVAVMWAPACRTTGMADDSPVSGTERRALVEREGLVTTIAEEYRQMAGLSLTQAQAQRLFHVDADRFGRLLRELVERGIVKVDSAGLLVRGDRESSLRP